MVEVLESSWTEYLGKIRQATDLDQVIRFQKEHVADILQRAFLSDKQRDLFRIMQQILNSVYLFTKIQVTQQYREAVEESKRIDNI